MSLHVNRAATDTRRALFNNYMAGEVANTESGLVCRSAGLCIESAANEGAEFYGGQLGHIGRSVDISTNDKVLRLLVVGQEFGRKPDSLPIAGRATGSHDVVTVEQRHADLVDLRGGQSFNERNAHMRGTSLAVRTVLEAVLGMQDPGTRTDRAGEDFRDTLGEPFHMFDAFALTNMLLCSANPPGSTKGVPTTSMRHNCRRHLEETIRVLEPTLVIIQKAPRVAFSSGWIGPLVRSRRPTSSPNLWHAKLGDVDCLLVAVNHPSAGNAAVGWQWPTFPYWGEVVRPALIEAVRLLA